MSSRLRTRLRAGTGLATASLSLEFATASGTLDPRITFSRGSQATVTDATGKLTYAPNNLLTNSETFEASGWTKLQSTVTANATTAPDGTMTADALLDTAVNNIHYAIQNPASAVGNSTIVVSVYAKASTLNYVTVGVSDISVGTSYAVAVFNLSNGTLSTSGASGTGYSIASTSITSVGNGWYRCAVTCVIGTVSAFLRAAIGVNKTGVITASAGGMESYLGNGSGIFIWGAQLEQVTYQTTPGTYNSTSPKNLLGFTQEFDNAAWTKSNAFVQTNLLTYSEAFDNALWTKAASTVTANATAAPDGTMTADAVIENTATIGHSVSQAVSGTTVGATYTASVYAKPNGRNWIIVELFGASTYASFNIATGTVGTAVGSPTTSITAVGNGWYRCTISKTIGGAITSARVYLASADNTETYTGNGTSGVFLWGAQLVQGSTAGDYQRTDAAAAAVQYTAPDGSRTADKLVETTAASTVHQISQIYSGAVASGIYTFNVYLAKNERDKAVVIVSDNATGDCRVVVDLTAGTVGSPTITGNWTTASAIIQAASNGFFRVSITCTKSASGNTSVVPVVGLYTTSASYTGDGTSGIYIWGAQLSNSASLDAYSYNPVAAPTSAAYYGPRFDFNPVTLQPRGLLIEEQRTNLLTYSEQFDNAAWLKARGSVTANTITSPDGTTSADTLAATATGTYAAAYRTSISYPGGTAYTFSVYAKAAAGQYLILYINETGDVGRAIFDLNSGAISSISAGTTASATSVGNGWWRCIVTATPAVTASGINIVGIVDSGTVTTVTSGKSLYIYGAQLEAGSFATSYIPTVASQVTRTAETPSMQGANFSNWYNQNAGTFAVEADSLTTLSASYLLTASDGTSNNRVGFYRSQAVIGGYIITGGVTLMEYTVGNVTVNVPFDTALAATANDGNFSFNGSISATDTSLSMPVATKLDIGHINSSGSFNGHISRIGYYPTRLSNEQLQALTAQSTIPSLSLDFTTQVFNVG